MLNVKIPHWHDEPKRHTKTLYNVISLFSNWTKTNVLNKQKKNLRRSNSVLVLTNKGKRKLALSRIRVETYRKGFPLHFTWRTQRKESVPHSSTQSNCMLAVH